jgi:diguanylate cyclase (GGDEF)-like protein
MSRTDGGISSDGIDLLAILQASQALSSQTTIDGLRNRAAGLLGAMAGATSVKVVLWYDELEGWALPSDGDGGAVPVEEAAANGQLPLSAFRYALRMEAPLVVEDALQHDRFAQDPHFAGMQRCSLLVLPVRNQGKTRAVLVLENRLSRGVFSHARLDAVTLVAGQLAVSLDNAQLYASLERRVADRTEALAIANRRLEALSISDALTGLANRRCFDDVLQREWSRALRGHDTIAAVMIDIDFFKRYNDHYGHVAGDRCLRTVAAVLHASVRQDIDLAARYGGEEFVFILPGSDIAAAAAVAERVCATMVALQEPHAGSDFGYLTVSIGVAALVADDEAGAAQLIERADTALYRAKQQGRNRLELAAAMPSDARKHVAA